MEKFLKFLDGKKAMIMGISNAINAYLVAAAVITPEMGALISSILVVLGGGAIVATNQVLGAKYRVK